MKLLSYLTFNGTCEAAFRFYESALGGEVTALFPYGGSPMAAQMPPEMRDKVMHVSLEAKGATLMGSDAPPDRFKPAQGFAVSVNVDTADEAERIFAALSEGATVGMPIQETFWATRFGMLVDRFGTPWMVNCEKRGV